VIVDHQLQPQSALVAADAAEKCRALGLSDVRVKAVVVTAAAGLEADARTARYSALQAVAAEVGARAIVLAHNLNDQAETVLLRLARGSGVRSLAGMRPVTAIENGVPLWRPLLGVPREHLALSLQDYHLDAHEDAHNSDERFLRVKIRQRLMPLLREVIGEGVDLALSRTAWLSQMDADALDAIAARAWPDCIDSDEVVTSRMAEMPLAIQTRILRTWLVARGAKSASLTLEHVMAVHRLMSDPRISGPIKVAGGLEVSRESGRLRA
jgi:tRNA(Ile)-lysidine synthase